MYTMEAKVVLPTLPTWHFQILGKVQTRFCQWTSLCTTNAWSELPLEHQSSASFSFQAKSVPTRTVCTCMSLGKTSKLTPKKTCKTTNSFSRSSRKWPSSSTTVSRWLSLSSWATSSRTTRLWKRRTWTQTITIILCCQSPIKYMKESFTSWKRHFNKGNRSKNASVYVN